MKRLLAIFVTLLLVLGGLFWWRKNQNLLNYKKFDPNSIPLINNHKSFLLTHKSFGGNVSMYVNLNPFKKFPSYHDISSLGLKATLWNGQTNVHALNGPKDIVKFNVYKNLLICECIRYSYSYAVYHFNQQSSYDSTDGFMIENFPFKTYTDKKSLIKEVYGTSEDLDLDLKTFNEWSLIWKKEGRLPWFPEHVGR